MTVARIIDKTHRELYRIFHPQVWGKRLQINGIPRITDYRNIKIGVNVSINKDVYIQSSGRVIIGSNVTLSKGVTILTEGLDTSNYIENAQKQYRDHIIKEVVIGNGTWIASGVIVCPGIEIAANSIIAAGSVVVKNLTEEGVVYGGVPAKKIRELTT